MFKIDVIQKASMVSLVVFSKDACMVSDFYLRKMILTFIPKRLRWCGVQRGIAGGNDTSIFYDFLLRAMNPTHRPTHLPIQPKLIQKKRACAAVSFQ